MFFSTWDGLLRSGLRRSFKLAASRPRRRVRCSLSKAAVELEARVLPAATPVGDQITVATPAEDVHVYTGSSQSVAVDDDGNFVVVWVQYTGDPAEDGGDSDIMAQLFNADGTPVGAAFLVNTTTADLQTQPVVAMNSSGEFVVSWLTQHPWINQWGGEETYDDVYARRFDADGNALGSDFMLSADVDDHRGMLEVAIHDDGSFMAVWNIHDSDANSSQAFIRRYDSTGAAIGNEAAIAYGLFMTFPDIEFTPDGGFLLAYTDDASLWVARFDANANPIGYPAYVHGNAWISSPSIAVDASGDFVIAWDNTPSGHGGSGSQAYARRFTADGVADGEAFVVSSSELGHYDLFTSVAMSADGNFVVTWMTRDLSQPNTLNGIVARAFNSDGVPIGDQFVVSPGISPPGYSAYTAVAMTPAGEFIINWAGYGDGVYAQRYEFNLVPTDIALSNSSVAENSPTGTVVGTLSAIDADGDDTFTYELVTGDGADNNAAFQIVGNELQTAAVFDYESKSTYTIRVRATDLTGASIEKTLTIHISNVLEPQVLTLSHNAVAENLPRDTLVGQLGLTDAPDGSIRYRLVGGQGASGNGKFRISGNELFTSARFNFEKQASYSIRVQAIDSEGNVTIQVFTIQVTDVADAPTAITLSNSTVLGNKRAGTTIGRLTASSPNAGERFQFTLVDGAADNELFRLRGNALKTNARFDSAGQSTYTIRVRVTDGDGQSFEQEFTITIG